jgi:hypothetical protein
MMALFPPVLHKGLGKWYFIGIMAAREEPIRNLLPEIWQAEEDL